MVRFLLIACVVLMACCSAWAKDSVAEWSVGSAAVVQAYRDGGYPQALGLARKMLNLAEEAFGPEHHNTLISVNNLAALYQTTGRYGEAEPLYRRALEAFERILGAERPNTPTDGLLTGLARHLWHHPRRGPVALTKRAWAQRTNSRHSRSDTWAAFVLVENRI